MFRRRRGILSRLLLLPPSRTASSEMIPILDLSLEKDDALRLAKQCALRVGLSTRQSAELVEALAVIEGDARVSLGLDTGAFVVEIDGDERRYPVDDSRFDAQGLTELRLELVANSARTALGELKRQNSELLEALAEKELAREAQATSERRLELAAEAAGLGTWEVLGGVVTLSRRASELLETESPITLNELAESLNEGGRRLLLAIQQLEANDDVTVDVQTDARWLQLRGAKIGQPPRAVGTVLDVSERRERERDMRLRLDFERQLVGIVSHDLKSPLAAIAMGAGMLEDADPFVVKRVQSSVRRAQKLIYDLLDFTRARLGAGIPVEKRRINLVSIVEEHVAQSRLEHPSREIVLVAPQLVDVHADPARLGQVVTNLLSNAVEYGAGAQPITVRCGTTEHAFVSVHNGGEQIAHEQLESIFEPLERAQPGERGSLGLGLFIVDQIVRAHDGEIRVQSNEDETVFTVLLPRYA